MGKTIGTNDHAICKNILIVKTHAIGDVLMTTPAIRQLAKAHPHARISMLVGEWSAAVVQCNPYINELIRVSDTIFFKKKFLQLFQIIVSIRKKKFDTVFIFHPSEFVHFFIWLTGIKVRYGLARTKKARFLTHCVDENVERNYYYTLNFVNLVARVGAQRDDCHLDIFYSDSDALKASQLLKSYALENREYLICAPGGGSNSKESIHAKRWPVQSYIRLLESLRVQYPQMQIVLTGSGQDAEVINPLVREIPNCINFVDKTSILVLSALIKGARLIICNDSAIMHIALALHIPFISFFGPTDSSRLVPEASRQYCLQSSIDCSPCFEYAFFKGCNRNLACMNGITVDRVIKKIEEIL